MQQCRSASSAFPLISAHDRIFGPHRFGGCGVVECLVWPLVVVEDLDVVDNSIDVSVSFGELGAVHEFFLERGKKRFRRRIIEPAADVAHR